MPLRFKNNYTGTRYNVEPVEREPKPRVPAALPSRHTVPVTNATNKTQVTPDFFALVSSDAEPENKLR